ncbi:small multi-drug export protein [Paenibacillus sp. J5C_2022]|uniref:small multi-drug export protein n=1 Tax=Paenibacillus sp. J5C2022 TaxID=2977129 RepID=UPI0021D3D063|nr:small multi-drug export protein [Paenibacillus sp. J5C2022]MCU6710998.1 small multi-drug export protein [Paenibacillus sp. J5C2022]
MNFLQDVNEVWQYVLVFLLGSIPWVEIAAIIPIAIIVAGMNPILVGLLALLGNLATVYLVILFFEKFKQWRTSKKGAGNGKSKRRERAEAAWNKYGMPGLALLGPLLIGSHIAAFVGILFGAKKRNAVIWMTLSLIVWTAVLTIASHYGINVIDFIRG